MLWAGDAANAESQHEAVDCGAMRAAIALTTALEMALSQYPHTRVDSHALYDMLLCQTA